MTRNIKVFHKLILSFLTVAAIMLKLPKITSFQYLRNDMLDYLDLWHMHSPTSHETNLLHMSIKRVLQIIIFI